MICIFRRQEREIFSVEPDAVEVLKVGVAASFLSNADEINPAILLVDAQRFDDIALPGGDLILQFSCS